jgi:hypothetical protein
MRHYLVNGWADGMGRTIVPTGGTAPVAAGSGAAMITVWQPAGTAQCPGAQAGALEGTHLTSHFSQIRGFLI